MNDLWQRVRELLKKDTVTIERIWLRSWGHGGNVTEFEFDAYIHEALSPRPFVLKLFAWAAEDLDAGSSL